jgi:hypothetical protein
LIVRGVQQTKLIVRGVQQKKLIVRGVLHMLQAMPGGNIKEGTAEDRREIFHSCEIHFE